MLVRDVLEWNHDTIPNLFIVKAYLLVDISLGLTNDDGVTKRNVEKGAIVDDEWGPMVASDTVLDGWICCKVFITSDFGTAENIIFALFKSVESRAIRLLGWCGSASSFWKINSKTVSFLKRSQYQVWDDRFDIDTRCCS
jgi:hypothetical protein